MIESVSYTIQLPVFEGPLDLLLELIERAELDITKVALANVTDQYLEYLGSVSKHQLEDLSSFLVIAARLLQIKSEALLPRPPEREPGEEDPGDALARQLVAYKKYKQIAVLLSEREEAGIRTFLRQAPAPLPEPSLDLEGVRIVDLRAALQELAAMERPSGVEIGNVVAKPVINIRDRISSIVDAIRRIGRITFRSVLKDVHSRVEIVVSFLAMLELVKQRQVDVEQSELFGEIEISPAEGWRADQDVDFELEFEE
ncbi:MAG: segregation/condensation protein A [Anaerolineales bacterium]